MRSLILGLAATAALVAACTGVSAEPGSYAAQRSIVRNDDGVQLELAVDRHAFDAGEPLALTTTLTYLGPRDVIHVDGSGESLVLHTIREWIGDRDQEVGFNLDCSSWELRRGEPMDIPLRFDGSWSSNGADAEFWRTFFSAPAPVLPSGTWMVDAVARYYPMANCDGGERLMTASLVIDVR